MNKEHMSLRTLRVDSGLTASQLARKLKVSQRTINDIETNQRHIKNKEEYAEALKIDIETLEIAIANTSQIWYREKFKVTNKEAL
jgi:DNA-binding XRE family transcriptional regulator